HRWLLGLPVLALLLGPAAAALRRERLPAAISGLAALAALPLLGPLTLGGPGLSPYLDPYLLVLYFGSVFGVYYGATGRSVSAYFGANLSDTVVGAILGSVAGFWLLGMPVALIISTLLRDPHAPLGAAASLYRRFLTDAVPLAICILV